MPLEGSRLEAFLQEPHLAHSATCGPDGMPRVSPVLSCYADGVKWVRIAALQSADRYPDQPNVLECPPAGHASGLRMSSAGICKSKSTAWFRRYTPLLSLRVDHDL